MRQIQIHFTRTVATAVVLLYTMAIIAQQQPKPAGVTPLQKIIEARTAQDSMDKRLDSLTIRLNKAIAKRDLVKKNKR